MTLKPANFRLEEELLDALERIRERDGISATEQVRRAIKMWIEAKGVSLPKKRASLRKR